ncbi:hypothetical protein [Aquabacterium humicola]|uniref:hypothetical protein n=1 Tax=Aquabacterium humicola TaxID=3237377 RepID=UPI0025432C76|nr:hypothetical protein [Rubrivivax pictus]
MKASDPATHPLDGVAPPGHRLASFELQRVAHRDADHVVYQAWDHALRIPVAVKEYLPSALARRRDDGQVEPLPDRPPADFRRGLDAFIDEARLLARCDHPSLVRVHQLLRLHGTAYWVMPWFAGRTWRQARHDRSTPPDEATLRRLLTALLGALEAFQRLGGVHGGVNPSRILLGDDGRVLLLGPTLRRPDAGATRLVDPRPAEPGFLAPELLQPSAERRTGPWTDFFALSRTLRFMLTGLLPPPDGTAPEPLAATIEQLYFDLPQLRYGERLLQALDAAGSPEIDERPQTVAEFRQWLAQGVKPPSMRPAPAAADVPPPDAPAIPGPPAPAAGPMATAAAPVATAADEEAVDPATVDLIRRVLESIPERDEPAAAVTQAAAPALDLPDPPLPAPPRRQVTGARVLAGIALAGVAAALAWSWRPPSTPPASQPVASAAPAAPTPTTAAPVVAAAPAPEPAPAPSPPPPAATVAPAAPAVATTPPPATPPAPAPVARAGAAVEPPPPARKATGPRQSCGGRSDFALYRCMQQQCAKARWQAHPQCVRLRATDRVG